MTFASVHNFTLGASIKEAGIHFQDGEDTIWLQTMFLRATLTDLEKACPQNRQTWHVSSVLAPSTTLAWMRDIDSQVPVGEIGMPRDEPECLS